ncbi:pentatricopeptide repeat-containing protein At2g02750-like [Arachis duranensis]|uniref:Pentatricopeptide repeat-containing protein At2g02750-like n=1 Tax=Arachis duranensis TaxID=130453 RepID=A0A6P4BT95_ARADU|nr:pentatricopeptide repeat-containing protein At2g02750-like [Arachis duranensis]XP_015947524.1 pentatricopeptide repeat-containing protein At2g02750-like [Arachis duranensis]
MSIFSKSIPNNTLCLHHPSAAYALKVMFLPEALKVFKEMPQWNVVCFNAVLSGISQNGLPGEALKVHCLAVKLAVEFDVYVATSLVTVYSNCGDVSASEVFKEMPLKSVVSYNVFVSGLLQNGIPRLVLDVFKDMIMVGFLEVKPNSVTLVSARFACATLLYACFGRQVHGLALKFASYDEVILVTALVDMYSKCGCRHAAFNVFNAAEGNNRNLITWNSMISGMMLNAV